MNILLFDRDDLSDVGRVAITDGRLTHLRKVLQVKVGQRLRAGIVRGEVGQATVVRVDDEQVEFMFEPLVTPPIPKLDLVIAVPRPKALSRMLQAAASFGVRRIDVINAWRVDAAYFQSHKLNAPVLAEDLRLGCAQGGVTYVPDINVHRYFAAYVEEVLAPRLAGVPEQRLLIGHPDEPGWPSVGIEVALRGCASAPLTLVIGPDGGFIERELRSFAAIGGTRIHFGEAVLRSENALVAGMSQITLLQRLARFSAGEM